jgi:hypothetical protein
MDPLRGFRAGDRLLRLPIIRVPASAGSPPSATHLSPVIRAGWASQASRRQFLHAACVHYSRELVIADGWSRLGQNEIAAALQCVGGAERAERAEEGGGGMD